MESYDTFGGHAVALKDILGLSSLDLESLGLTNEGNISKHSDITSGLIGHSLSGLEWFEKAKSSLEVAFKFMSSTAEISNQIVSDTSSLKATLVTMSTRDANHLKEDTDDAIRLIQLILGSDRFVVR